MAYKFADLISDDSYKVKVCTAIIQVLAAQGVGELPCKLLVHSHSEQSTKDRDKLANTLQLANFYLKAGQVSFSLIHLQSYKLSLLVVLKSDNSVLLPF